ncbi:MAG: hypothetical protein BWK73_13940 [Thiothrix lacustris]|uniref:DUF1320 domain-containing protein n=1 Tax=Thiothrix lacustris TaxID=525917 RepID=A0A1Y1QSW3_9GAMM|nr:MAG: hypothetical protein BWK73_13940 [Thiothrix lacustris]
MNYCTQADIEARYGLAELTQLTDRNRTGTPDTTNVERAITDASAEIDGYLVGRHSLPFADVPPVLVRVACDLAVYHLFAARRSTGGVIDDVRNRYKDAVRLLENISNGKVLLGKADGQETPPAAPIAQRTRPKQDWCDCWRLD